MTKSRNVFVTAVVGFLALVLAGAPAQAVEYRLLVASIYDRALTSFVSASELYNGASGPGLDKMEQALDTGTMDRGVILVQRPLQSVPTSIARAWGGVAIAADILRGGIDTPSWDEVRWQGKPGERSIWIIRSAGNARPQEIVRVTLKGAGPMRLFQPYTVTNGNKAAALQLPLPLVAFHESHGNVWDKFVAKNLDLRQGIGAVVGLSNNALFPDLAYLIVDQGDPPTTFKAVITWRDRDIDRESPGSNIIRIRSNH
ncbi:MAG TPA: hypothetical protein VGT00_09210 [Methylomirabilota bacterium]|jgi:hypothetical protein|nr:hypothetical protein [Methylomirabilota bacterium]